MAAAVREESGREMRGRLDLCLEAAFVRWEMEVLLGRKQLRKEILRFYVRMWQSWD